MTTKKDNKSTNAFWAGFNGTFGVLGAIIAVPLLIIFAVAVFSGHAEAIYLGLLIVFFWWAQKLQRKWKEEGETAQIRRARARVWLLGEKHRPALDRLLAERDAKFAARQREE